MRDSGRNLKNSLRGKQSLTKRVIQGGIWVFSLRISNRILGLIRIIILARILSPTDFGLVGIALLTMSTLEVFSQTGFERALVQRKGNIKDYLDTAWIVLATRGILIFLILILSAPLVGKFFHSPGVVSIIQVIAISQILNGLRNIGVVYFQKELNFKKQFIYQFTGTIVEVTVAITLALLLRNVWAIVYGLLAGSVTRTAMSYLVHPYRPGAGFDPQKARELFKFGGWVFLSGILVFLLTQGDDALVGRILGTAALGFYTMAYRLSNLPATEIAHVVSWVTFPAYSKLQGDLSKLKGGYFRTLQWVSFVSLPLAGIIFILAPEFTKIFLGEKWMPLVPPMRILCVFGAIRSIQNTYGAVFLGIGRTSLGPKIGGIELGIMFSLIYPLTVKWGISGTAMSTLIAIFISCTVGMFYIQRVLKFEYPEFFRIIFPPLIGVFGFGLFAFLLKKVIWYQPNIGWFLILIISSFFIYLLLFCLMGKRFGYRLGELLRLFLPLSFRRKMAKLKELINHQKVLIFGYRNFLVKDPEYNEYWRLRLKSGSLPQRWLKKYRICSKLIEKGASVLDLGCGEGTFLKFLIENNALRKALGIEISELAVKASREKGIETRKGDIRDLSFLEKLPSYDYITLLDVLEHLPNPEEVLIGLKGKYKKGIIVSLPNTGYYPCRLRLLWGKFPMQWNAWAKQGAHLRYWTYKDFEWWIDILGFKREKFVPVFGVPFLKKIWPNLFCDSMMFLLREKGK